MTYDSATITATIERLPRFILLRGAHTTCHNFAHELAKHDTLNRIIVACFRDPMADAMIQSIYDGAYLELDWQNDPHVLDKTLPITSTISVGTYIEILTQNIRNDLGQDVLGKLFVKRYRDNGYEDMQPTFILKDFDNPKDADPLLKNYSQADLMLINLGKLDGKPQPIHRVYWIAVPEPHAQVQQLIHDLLNETRHDTHTSSVS